MPIRINLLAEAQALEEMRRRDPVKRAIWTGSILTAMLLSWSGYLQFKIIAAGRDADHIQGQISKYGKDYRQVTDSKKKLDDANHKLGELLRMATNRFLYGNVLDALQHTTVDDVQLVHFKTEHKYNPIEEIKSKTNATGQVVGGKPAMVTEKVTLTLQAKDNTGGAQAIKLKEVIGDNGYFQSVLGKTNEVRLATISPPTTSSDGKSYRQFDLEIRFPDKTR